MNSKQINRQLVEYRIEFWTSEDREIKSVKRTGIMAAKHYARKLASIGWLVRLYRVTTLIEKVDYE